MKYRPAGLDFEAFFVSCEAIERELIHYVFPAY